MQRLQAAWTRLPPTLRFGLAVVSALVTILSFPTLADGMAGWAGWLGFVGSTAASYIFPTLGLLGLVAIIGLQYGELRARRRDGVESLGPDELAAELTVANRAMQRMLEERWAGAPGRPEGSTPRNYFGPLEYAGETIQRYLQEHSERMAALLGRAHQLGYLPEGWAGLVANVVSVDHIWRLRYRNGAVVNRLKTKKKSPLGLAERRDELERVGRDIRNEMRPGCAAAFEEVQGTTPFQAFDAWWYDVAWLLARVDIDARRFLARSGVPNRDSNPAELATFIDLALAALKATSV